jgi:hypothetical protein
MLHGVFHVTFQSSLATMGEAVAVLDACGVHGANESHVFRGNLTGAGEGARLTLEVRHLQGEKYPSFGHLAAITLDMQVTAAEAHGFRATGSIREASGIRVNVVAKKLAGLVEN